MSRRFEYAKETWKVQLSGMDHGTPLPCRVPADHFGVWFTRVGGPSADRKYGWVSSADLTKVSDGELTNSLKRAIRGSGC